MDALHHSLDHESAMCYWFYCTYHVTKSIYFNCFLCIDLNQGICLRFYIFFLDPHQYILLLIYSYLELVRRLILVFDDCQFLIQPQYHYANMVYQVIQIYHCPSLSYLKISFICVFSIVTSMVSPT